MTVNYLNDADNPAVDAAPSSVGDPREDLGRYAELGGFTLTAEANPWYAAQAAATPEDARAASTALAELRSHDLIATRDSLTALLGDAATPGTLTELTRLTAVLQRAHGTSTALRREVYDADLDALTAALAPARWRREQGVKLPWGRRRALRAQAKSFALDGRARRADLLDAVRAAAATQSDWTAAAGAATRPVVADAAGLTAVAQAVEELGQAVRTLSALLPGQSLDTLPLAELADLVDRLAADEGTLYRLPSLRALHTALTDGGLGELLTELTERQADRDAALAAYDRLNGTATEAAAIQALAAGPREPEAEPEAEAVVEAVVEVEPEPEVVVEPEPEVAEVEAAVEVEPEVEVEVEAEIAEVEAAVEPEPEVVAEPEPVVEPEVEVVAEVTPEPEVQEPVVEPEPEPVAEIAVAEPELVEPEPEVAPEPVAEEPVVEESKPARRPKKPAITAGRAVTAYEPAELTALVRWIDSDGTERSEDELLRAAVKELGFSRVGPRLKEALAPAVAEARA
ncbi:hypothetical protein F4556_001423 [Kitasatospora gansuensis]|uniref:Uncharacterized protein n=1 Tax=Kitasatospora gansuensis TaxID=258050 RepID=A0A7W7S8L0_9ACTN|nr:hypothetical protein [Kitasatospora gansuensis]MBB4945888.1 hypothetical protein [Kitasatospora gansuensis]